MRTLAKARTGTGKITIDKDDELHHRRNQITDISKRRMSYVKCMGLEKLQLLLCLLSQHRKEWRP